MFLAPSVVDSMVPFGDFVWTKLTFPSTRKRKLMSQFTAENIEHMFGNHKATVEGPEATLPQHKNLRWEFKDVAHELNKLLPDGREKGLVFEHLEIASMFAHKSIASGAPLTDDGVRDE